MNIYKHVSVNDIRLEHFPFTRELAMESYLIENESILNLEGFEDASIIDAEIPLINGRANGDGRLDILAKYGSEYMAIIELKKGTLNEGHLDQLKDYLDAKDTNLKQYIGEKDSEEPKWIGILVGESIEPELMQKIKKGCYHNGNIPIAALTLTRYRGQDNNVYVVTDTYFVDRVSGRDYSKYSFNGNLYGKGRLVLAVIKDYVSKNPTSTYSQLENIFPAKLQGHEVFTTEAIALGKADRRNFIEANELITLGDGSVIAVSTQWGIKNINVFIEHVVEKMGYKITPTKY